MECAIIETQQDLFPLDQLQPLLHDNTERQVLLEYVNACGLVQVCACGLVCPGACMHIGELGLDTAPYIGSN